MTLTSHDQRLLQRFRDGEMSAEESVAFRARLEAEPEMHNGLAELEELARGFVLGRSRTFGVPVGFTSKVMDKVRQVPNRNDLQQVEVAGAALVLCRRLLLAAAILFGIGLLWHAGLFPDGRSDKLEAGPAAVEREMERLDAIIKSWDRPSGAENRATGVENRHR